MADQVLRLAPTDPAKAVGAFDRLPVDGLVLDRVARPQVVIAECRIRLWVLHEVPDSGRLIQGRPSRPKQVVGPAADVDQTPLIQDRVRHTAPVRVKEDRGPVPDAGRATHPVTVDLASPMRSPFTEDTRLVVALVLIFLKTRRDRPHRAGDRPRPVRAGSRLTLVF